MANEKGVTGVIEALNGGESEHLRSRLTIDDVDLAELGIGDPQLQRLSKTRLITVGEFLLGFDLGRLILSAHYLGESEEAKPNASNLAE